MIFLYYLEIHSCIHFSNEKISSHRKLPDTKNIIFEGRFSLLDIHLQILIIMQIWKKNFYVEKSFPLSKIQILERKTYILLFWIRMRMSFIRWWSISFLIGKRFIEILDADWLNFALFTASILWNNKFCFCLARRNKSRRKSRKNN